MKQEVILKKLAKLEKKHNHEQQLQHRKAVKEGWADSCSIDKFSLSLKYFKRLNMFKASNVTFNPETCVADSYDWWIFVKKIKGKVVFNSYRYSPSTSRHQSKVRSLLKELGIKVDYEVRQYESLSKGITVGHLYEKLFAAEIHNANPKTRKKYSKKELNSIKKDIKIARMLGAEFSKQLIKEMKVLMIKNEAYRIEKMRQDRLFVKNALKNQDLFKVA